MIADLTPAELQQLEKLVSIGWLNVLVPHPLAQKLVSLAKEVPNLRREIQRLSAVGNVKPPEE